jgi:putative transposase
MTTGLRQIFRAEDKRRAREAFLALAGELEGKADGAALETLENDLEDALAVLVLLEKYRIRLRTTNMVERLHEEIRRRERVIRIFPNQRSALRLISALLAEHHEEWPTGKRYFEWKNEMKEKRKEREAEETARSVAL